MFNNRKDVTAIFASNNATAVGVMQYIKDNGYKIPDDVSLVGFDDVEADLLIDPPLTTIRVPKVEMGTEAVRLLLDILNNKSNSTKSTVVQVELIIRESTRAIKK